MMTHSTVVLTRKGNLRIAHIIPIMGLELVETVNYQILKTLMFLLAVAAGDNPADKFISIKYRRAY